MINVKGIGELIDELENTELVAGTTKLSDHGISINFSTKNNHKGTFAEFEFDKSLELEHRAVYSLAEKIASVYDSKYQENLDDDENYDYDIHEINPLNLWVFTIKRFGEVIAKVGPKKFGIHLGAEYSKKLATYIFDLYITEGKIK